MGRWEPDARGRLAEAALDLYSERGYDTTTVAEIAERAGVTERTFFRYFADKREVLFSGTPVLVDAMMSALAATSASEPPLDQVAAALRAAGDVFLDRAVSRRRAGIIASNTDLQERELIKMARLSAEFAEALRKRGIPEPAASLAAETGIAVFKVAFGRWVGSRGRRGFADFVDESLAELRTVTTGGGTRSARTH